MVVVSSIRSGGGDGACAVCFLGALLAALFVSGCGLDVNGNEFFPTDAGVDVLSPPPVDAAPDVSRDAPPPVVGGPMPPSLSAGATVVKSHSYAAVVSLGGGGGATGGQVVTSSSYTVVGAVVGVSPK